MSEPVDPLEALLSRVEPRLRKAVADGRDSGDWDAATEALVGAARARPGPRHLDYARLLLALDRFAECRNVLDRSEGAVDDTELRGLRAELLLEEAATTWWSPIPGRPSKRVPTTVAAIEGVVVALRAARALEPSTPQALAQIEAFQRAVTWSLSEPRTGGLAGPLGAFCLAVVAALFASEPGGGRWMVPTVLYSAAAPLLFLGGGRPQVEVNARVVSGQRTLDELFLDGLALTAPLLAPLGLLGRMAVHGLLAPATVLMRSIEQRRIWPSAALSGALALGIFLSVTQAPLEPAIEPVVPPSSAPVVLALPDGPLELELGAESAAVDVAGAVSLELSRRDGRVVSAVFRAPAEHPAPDFSAWGPATRTRQLDAGTGPCRIEALDYGESEGVSARATRCATSQTWEIRRR